jgi:hypothetical protein
VWGSVSESPPIPMFGFNDRQLHRIQDILYWS